MKIFIGLVTPDSNLRQHFRSGVNAVIPKAAMSRGEFRDRRPSVILGIFSPEDKPSSDDFERFLLSRAKDSDACLLLVDEDWAFVTTNVRGAMLSLVFNRSTVGASAMNFFHKETSKLLRAIRVINANFSDSDDAQLLSLPVRNFHAIELKEIARICREECSESDFQNRLDRQLSKMRDRRRPRRRSDFKKKYIVDDRARFFEYGKEKHAQFETGAPHRPFCALNGYFRFGRSIDRTRHYNVSETEGDRTSIKGEFDDCHDTRKSVHATTHLNMFSNDFF